MRQVLMNSDPLGKVVNKDVTMNGGNKANHVCKYCDKVQINQSKFHFVYKQLG